MRRMLTFLLGLLAGAALARALRRPGARRGPDQRADELRRKLAASREGAPGAAAPARPEPPLPPEAAEPPTVEDARRRVHERARAATEEMRRPDSPPAGG